jgi:hypothetical protein
VADRPQRDADRRGRVAPGGLGDPLGVSDQPRGNDRPVVARRGDQQQHRRQRRRPAADGGRQVSEHGQQLVAEADRLARHPCQPPAAVVPPPERPARRQQVPEDGGEIIGHGGGAV